MTTTRAETAMSVFEGMEAAGVEYAVVRNHEEIPIDPGRDIDLLADPDSMPEVERILVGAKHDFGWEILVRCRGHHEGTSYYFLGPIEAGKPRQLEIHFTRIRWAGATILGPADLVARRIKAHSGIWIAAPEHSVVQRLLQQGLSGGLGDMKEKYWDEMGEVCRTRGEAVIDALTDVLGDRGLAQQGVEALARSDRGGVGDLTADLRRSFLLAGGGTRRLREAPDIARFVVRKRLRGLAPPLCGVVARVDPASGPELVDEVESAVSHMFLETRRIDHAEVGTQAVLSEAADVVARAGLVFVTAPEPFGAGFRWIPRVSVWVQPRRPDEGVDLVLRRFVANHSHVPG